MKSLLAQEMSKQKESKRRSPSIIARLMGLDILPPQSMENQQGRSNGGSSYKSLGRSLKDEQKFKDVFEVSAERNGNLYHQGKVKANLSQAEMAFIRQKFMEAKRLSTDDKLRHSKEFNDTLEALDSNKDLLLKFLQHPDSLFKKHLHDLQSMPQYSQAPSLKSRSSQRYVDSLKTDRELLRKSHRSPLRYGGSSHSQTRQASYVSNELQPIKIVVLKPNLREPRASPSSSSDEFRVDCRLSCTSNHHGRQRSNEDIRHSRQNSGEMLRQGKVRCCNSTAMRFETSRFRGYAGDESSSGSDSSSETELMPVISTNFNRKNYCRFTPTKSSLSRETNRRLSERWKLTQKYEQKIELSRTSTLAEMLATSDREASFNGLSFENNAQWSEFPEPVGISSKDGWSRNYLKSKAILNQESTCGYTIVLPKGSPEVNIYPPSLTKVLYTNSDTDSSSDSDDIKTEMSYEALDFSAVTSVTDPDISRKATEDLNQSLVPEPQFCKSSKERDQPSPVSVLESSFCDVSSSSECFESVSTELQGLRKQLELLKLESAAYNEGAMVVSSDEETDEEESSVISQEVGEEDWKSLYLVDLLANSRFSDSTPVNPSLFDDLETKYSKTSTRLDRKFLFDQISIELIKILEQVLNPHPWVKPIRACLKLDTNKVEETLYGLITRKEKDVEENELQWLSFEDGIEIIGREIEEILTDELITDLLVYEMF